MKLYDHQKEALKKMKNGCILCGGVGSGKSRTALAYYYISQGLSLEPPDPTKDFNNIPPKDLYIITTARKRDTLEWEGELVPFLMHPDYEKNPYWNHVTIDSWNNIGKYKDVTDSFFIFDEQRVVGKGAWAKTFIKISKSNEWILLSATPGDTWTDYIPVFIANGFYRNRTEFTNEHIVYSNTFTKYPVISRFCNTGKLNKYRNDILVTMDYKKPAVPHHENIFVDYDRLLYKDVLKNRWNYRKEEPIVNSSDLCYELRRVSNIGPERLDQCRCIAESKQKVIIFYNFNYELEALREEFNDFTVAEWNGQKHEPVPQTDSWVYLVQYAAGAEGWNCISTDTIIFFSQNYSFKTMVQASGRIDRLNTPYTDLYFYHLKSHSGIDLAISDALKHKKKFNESAFVQGFASGGTK